MKVNASRTLALAAVAVALLLAVSALARQQGDTKSVKKSTPTGHEHHGKAAPAKAPAAEKSKPSEGKYMTIVGEVMDPACFLEAGVKSIGPGHYQCAYDCARSGQTLAIYARDEDRIYFIAGELPGVNPNDPVIAYVHKKVDVTGTVYHRAGAYGIVITKVALHEEKPSKDKKAEAAGAKAGSSAAPPGK